MFSNKAAKLNVSCAPFQHHFSIFCMIHLIMPVCECITQSQHAKQHCAQKTFQQQLNDVFMQSDLRLVLDSVHAA